MFGHWVGSCAEVAIKINICSHVPTKYKDLCSGSTVFIHELLVEPIVNALFFKFVSQMITHKPDNSWLSLLAGAITSLYLNKLPELIPADYKPKFIDDNEAWISALVSLPGNYFGEISYEAFAQTNHLFANAFFGGLLSYKVYSNLYLSEEHNATADDILICQHSDQRHYDSDNID